MGPKGRCSVSVAPVEDLGTRPGTLLAFCSCDPAEMSGILSPACGGDGKEGGGTGSQMQSSWDSVVVSDSPQSACNLEG